MQHCVAYKWAGWNGRAHRTLSWRFSPSISLDESLLADIDVYLALQNQVELAAAHNSAEDDSDDIIAYECG